MLCVGALVFCACGKEKEYFELDEPEEIVTSDVVETDVEIKTDDDTKKDKTDEINHHSFVPLGFIKDYSSALTAAINNGEFSIVEKYLLKGSKLYNAQASLVKNLHSQGVKEYMNLVELRGYRWVSDTKGFIETYEKAEIIQPSGDSEIREYNWRYTVEYENGKYYLSDIEAI